MFTGIIQNTATVKKISQSNLTRLTLQFPLGFLHRVKIGASISVDGVCLTLVKKRFRTAEFDIMSETIKLTTLGDLKVGDQVNIERSFRVGDEIGGHIISGHIYEKAQIIDQGDEQGTHFMRFKFSNQYTDLVHQKGFIALNGASLTVSNYDPENAEFSIYFIPETLEKTTFGQKKVGDFVNIEYYQK